MTKSYLSLLLLLYIMLLICITKKARNSKNMMKIFDHEKLFENAENNKQDITTKTF